MSTYNSSKRGFSISTFIDEESEIIKEVYYSLGTLEIYNSFGEILYKGLPQATLNLEKGIYRARVFFGDFSKDTLFSVRQGHKDRIALKAPDYTPRSKSLEFLNPHAGDILEEPTYLWTSYVGSERQSFGISITIANISENDEEPIGSESWRDVAFDSIDIFPKFSDMERLSSVNGKYCYFRPRHSNSNSEVRSVSYLPPGSYRVRLEVHNKKARWIPVQIFPGYECKIFIDWKNGFSLDSLSIFYLNCEEITTSPKKYIINCLLVNDLFLGALASNRPSLMSNNDLSHFVERHRICPYIGIIGLYILARSHNITAEEVKDYFFKIFAELQYSSDVAGIFYLAGDNFRSFSIFDRSDIPTLSAGTRGYFEYLLNKDETLDYLDDIENFFIGKLASRIWSVSSQDIEHLYYHSKQSGIGEVVFPSTSKDFNFLSDALPTDYRYFSDTVSGDIPTWLQESVLNSFSDLSKNEQDRNEPVDLVGTVSRKYGILPSTVKSIVNRKLITGLRSG